MIVVQLLRGYYNKHNKSQDEYLEYLQHSYNRAIHSSIGKSPFETYFNYFPPLPFDYNMFDQQKNKGDSLMKEEKQVEAFMERIKQIHLKV